MWQLSNSRVCPNSQSAKNTRTDVLEPFRRLGLTSALLSLCLRTNSTAGGLPGWGADGDGSLARVVDSSYCQKRSLITGVAGNDITVGAWPRATRRRQELGRRVAAGCRHYESLPLAAMPLLLPSSFGPHTLVILPCIDRIPLLTVLCTSPCLVGLPPVV
jgi:hypothetical protein